MGQNSSAPILIADQTVDVSTLSTVAKRVRRMLVIAFVAAVAYATLTTASKSFCTDETDSDAPRSICVQLTLSPSPLVFAALLAVIVFALSRVSVRGVNLDAALQIFDRSTIVMVMVAGVATIGSHIWFWAIPLAEFASGTFSFLSPILIGIIELKVLPTP